MTFLQIISTAFYKINSAYGVTRPVFKLLIVALLFGPLSLSHVKANETPVILAFGDSLTAGYGLEAEYAFPTKLQAALHNSGVMATVINGGVSGDTTAGGLARLDWMMTDNPDLVIIELGANDGLRALDPDDTRKNLSAILKRLQEKQVRILLTGMLAPPNLGTDYEAKFNSIFPDLANLYGVAFYPFFLEGVISDPALNQGDGIHPNAEGVDIVVSRILPYVTATLRGEKYP